MPEPSELRNLLAETVTASEAAEKPLETGKSDAAVVAPEGSDTPSGGRPRGPDGKFLPKDAVPPEEPEEETESGEEEGEPEEQKPAESVVEVPQHWSQADKDLVAKLPTEHRQAVVDRYKAIEAGFTPKLQRAAELEKQFGPAQEIFAPYAEVLRQRGQTPSDIVKIWASMEQGFVEGMRDASQGRPNEKGATLIANLIRNYKIDPGAVAAILQGQPRVNGADNQPPPVAIPQEVLQKIYSLEQWKINSEQAAQTERVGAAQRQIDSFAAEKDAAGNLAHPYFSEVESDMMALAQIDRSQGKPSDLADLYDRALYANRETRTKLLAAKEAEAKQKAAADRKARAAAAQRAASSVTGSPGSGQSPNEQRERAKSLREELEANAADSEAA